MIDKISNVDIEEAVNYKPIYKGPFDLSQFISKEDFPHFINQLDLLCIKPYIQNFDFDPYARDGKSYIETSKLMLMPNGDLPEVIITNYPLFNKAIVKYLEEFQNNKLQYPPDGVVLRFKQQMDTIKQIISTKYKDYERICLNDPLPQCRILECLILLYQENYIEFCPDISIKAGSSTPSDVYFTITDKFKIDCLQYPQAASKNIQIPEVNPKIEQITTTDEDNKKGIKRTKPKKKQAREAVVNKKKRKSKSKKKGTLSYLGITITPDNKVTYKGRKIPFSSKIGHKQLALLRLLLECQGKEISIDAACKKVKINGRHRQRITSWRVGETSLKSKKIKNKYETKYERLRHVSVALKEKFKDDDLIFQCNKGGVCLLKDY